MKNIPSEIRAALSDDRFKVYAQSRNETAELLIMEEIGKDIYGEGVSATDVIDFLRDHKGKPVNVRLNSGGGLVFDGLTIYNALKSHDGPVTATIEGLAYSAASVIAMGASRIEMYNASSIGIHRAWGVAVGNAKTARGLAEWLDVIDQQLIDIYSNRTGNDAGQVELWLDGTDDGTLFSAKDATANGFADQIIDSNDEPPKNISRYHEMMQASLKAKHAQYRHLMG
jgi:ATP-dependent Clp protease protease subunit